MPLVSCPDCANSDNPKRCPHCRGPGINLDPTSGACAAAPALILGIRDKCGWCGGDGQCKTCGGRAVTEERRREETNTPQTEASTARHSSHPGSKETDSEARDEGSSRTFSGLGVPIG